MTVSKLTPQSQPCDTVSTRDAPRKMCEQLSRSGQSRDVGEQGMVSRVSLHPHHIACIVSHGE